MTVSTPPTYPIYTRPMTGPKVTILGRLVALAIAVAAAVVLGIAVRLPPSPAGHGTHQQLGLQSCQFLDRFGIPCPSCGMTTSFSHFVRGNIVASAYVQPMGMVLALLAGSAVWVGCYIAITGRPAHRVLRAVNGLTIVLPLLGLAIAAWAWKIMIYVSGIDGWK